jgi:hypothetical protein
LLILHLHSFRTSSIWANAQQKAEFHRNGKKW